MFSMYNIRSCIYVYWLVIRTRFGVTRVSFAVYLCAQYTHILRINILSSVSRDSSNGFTRGSDAYKIVLIQYKGTRILVTREKQYVIEKRVLRRATCINTCTAKILRVVFLVSEREGRLKGFTATR